MERTSSDQRVGDFARFNQLNITAEMSPAGFFDYEKTGLNMPLINWDFERMAQAKNRVTIGSDWVNGMTLPMLPAVDIIARKVGAEKTLEMITLAGARATNREQVRYQNIKYLLPRSSCLFLVQLSKA